jgi:N-acetylglucosaminyldiphosphoundecaprenol N-acetyl-beta-D-mannosaminyltransferase
MGERLRIGEVPIDVLTFEQALDEIEALVEARAGGYVVTPNIDHVVLAEDHPGFRAAYQAASLSLVDGMPLVWASRAVGRVLPERISGSDVIPPLMERAAKKKWRVYFLGGADGVAQATAEKLKADLGIEVAGFDAPMIPGDPDPTQQREVLEKLKATKPDLVLVALGAPKQELWMYRCAKDYSPAVALGIGAGLDFVIGRIRRAPRWMQTAGLEWAHRLASEPKRLWRRYLVNDPKFVLILARTLTRPTSERVFPHSRQGLR